MKKLKKLVIIFLTVAMVLSLGACSSKDKTIVEENALTIEQKNYLEKIDVDYSYDLALRMEEIRSNETLGYRTAGSKAEFLTEEMLKSEMEKIGLENVTKDEFTLDGWTFNHARLTYTNLENKETTIELGGYHTNINLDEEITIINAGDGTKDDLDELDVEGKWLLVNINQRDNWWINYPSYEAYIHGAAGIIAAQNGGYGEVSDDALNARDFCGPEYTPALSISQNDAQELREIMDANHTNEITAKLDALSVVEKDVKSHNIVGIILGKSDEMVLMSEHYDSYFAGFQDDN